MYLVYFVLFTVVGGLQGDKVEEGHCDKDGKCDSSTSGKPVIFKETPRDINNYPPLNDEFYVIPDGELPRVLWWHDHIYPHGPEQKEVDCKVGRCKVSKDRETFKDPLTRGIIFYGTSIENDDWPLPRLPYHEWALFHEESPKNNWMLSTEEGISVFNHTATFRRESDYPLSTQFMKDPDRWFEDKYFIPTEEKNRLQKEKGLAPLVFIQRDCNPPSDRDTFVKELMKHINIDSYGLCVNNKKMPEDIDGFHLLSSEKYYKFLAQYKFQIAIENALCPDYMTEKIFRPLDIGSVPVYLGSERVLDFMPSHKSVILISDFETPKDLADYLLELNNDDIKYNEHLAHRKSGITNPEFHKSVKRQPWKLKKWQLPNFGHFMFAKYSCHVCDKLHERNNRLKKHLKDNSVAPLPTKFGKLDHLGCPLGKPYFGGKKFRPPNPYVKELKRTSKAWVKMLLANETNSGSWKKYLD